jgi:hypothetical protein
MAAVSSSLSRWRRPLFDDNRRQPSIEPLPCPTVEPWLCESAIKRRIARG